MIEWLQLTAKRPIEILNSASNQIFIAALILLHLLRNLLLWPLKEVLKIILIAGN